MNPKQPAILIVLVVVVLGAAGAFYVQRNVSDTTNVADLTKLLATQPIMPDMDLPKLGAMPDFVGISSWINSEPLTPTSLKGKVVLVDFWTYSCINCIRTLPYVTDWYAKYKDEGLVVIGVHTPEFDFEKDRDNVIDAIKRHGIEYPVAQDNTYATWNAYHNRFWPAEYLFDRDGVLRYTHFGEGNYDVTEETIQKLLNTESELTQEAITDFSKIRSPETYFGFLRAERFASPEKIAENVLTNYSFPTVLPKNSWALSGQWMIADEYAEAAAAKAELLFRYNAGSANIVMESADGKPVTLSVAIDGKPVAPVTVSEPKLYTMYAGNPGEHELQVTFPTSGVKIYAITFGAE